MRHRCPGPVLRGPTDIREQRVHLVVVLATVLGRWRPRRGARSGSSRRSSGLASLPRNRSVIPAWHRMRTDYPARRAAAGVVPGEVDYVLCTHLHADHVG